MLDNRSVGREAIWPVIAVELGSAIVGEAEGLGTDQAEAPEIGQAEVAPIALEVEISRGAVAGIVTLLAVAPVATTDQAHVLAATVVPLAWDLVVAAASVVVVEAAAVAVGDGGSGVRS